MTVMVMKNHIAEAHLKPEGSTDGGALSVSLRHTMNPGLSQVHWRLLVAELWRQILQPLPKNVAFPALPSPQQHTHNAKASSLL